MSIIKWSPFIEPFGSFEKFMEEPLMQGFSPAIDIYENDKEVIVEAQLAGVNPSDVEISIEKDVLTIKGETKREREVEETNYYRKEIHSGKFFRSIALPAQVISDQASAESKEGMLKITIPKAEKNEPKKIQIKINKN